MEHIRLIDSLRGFAAFLVLISHVAFWSGASNIDTVGRFLARGDSGVAIFFAISAFLLLTPAFARAFGGSDNISRSWSTYAYRRAARILPAYWFAFAGVLAVGYFFTTPDGVGSTKKILTHVFLGQAFFSEQYQSFSQTWSLTTEVSFYVLVPALSWLIIRQSRRATAQQKDPLNRILTTIVVVAILGVITQYLSHELALTGPSNAASALGTSALGHSAWFATGAFMAAIVQAHKHGVGPASRSPWARFGTRLLGWRRSTLLLLALAFYALAATPLAGPLDLAMPVGYQVFAKELLYALFALVLLTAAIQIITPQTVLDGYANSGLNAWIGNTSYGVFLWHVLVLQVVFLATGTPLFMAQFAWTLQIVLTVTLAIASLSWYFLEKPILEWVRRRTTSAGVPERQTKP